MNRPYPPSSQSYDAHTSIAFEEASAVYEWVQATLFNPEHKWYNKDHEHLRDFEADEIAFVWANCGYEKAGKQILGQTEKVMIKDGGWKKARQEMWFINTLKMAQPPEFLITLDAAFCAECTDLQFAALVDHELYHIAHKPDEFGNPAFNRGTGRPKLWLVSHDVEEFHGITRRYGANIFDDSLQTMIDLSQLGGELMQ